jgi:hypothetical protein
VAVVAEYAKGGVQDLAGDGNQGQQLDHSRVQKWKIQGWGIPNPKTKAALRRPLTTSN